MRKVMIYLTGALIFFLSGCSNYEIPAPPCPEGISGMSFSRDIQPIFSNNCLACHSGNQSPDLSPGWSYDELTGGGFVDTEFPCSSLIYQAFSFSVHDGKLTEEEQLKILGWIQEGAQDN